jgi:RNA polymerase sigma-70 factor, ECF subfamily
MFQSIIQMATAAFDDACAKRGPHWRQTPFTARTDSSLERPDAPIGGAPSLVFRSPTIQHHGFHAHRESDFQMTGKSNEENEGLRPRPSGEDGDADINASIYKELRKIASAKMHLERGNHTLQPTALVHEAYLRLAEQPESAWRDRSRILGLAANAMRHILVDHARAHSAGKRGAGAVQVTLDEGLAASSSALADVLAVDEALTRLAEFDPRQARVLELHFFAGLTFDEIAAELGVSVRTIKSDWAISRAWLHQQLAT